MRDLKHEGNELKRLGQGLGVYAICSVIQLGKVVVAGTQNAAEGVVSKVQPLINKIQKADNRIKNPDPIPKTAE